ncbi:MAG: type II secretion system protein [Ignavibacteria bacterium]|nr:type II secretion system protein [Ignavibacteria bacterium]
MRVYKHIQREEGYTLLETLVAMALFVGVLIPVGASVGNLMIERTSDQINSAFHVAIKEMSRIAVDRDFVNNDTEVEGFIVHRKVDRNKNLIEVQVAVASLKKPNTTIVLLTKSFLTHK